MTSSGGTTRRSSRARPTRPLSPRLARPLRLPAPAPRRAGGDPHRRVRHPDPHRLSARLRPEDPRFHARLPGRRPQEQPAPLPRGGDRDLEDRQGEPLLRRQQHRRLHPPRRPLQDLLRLHRAGGDHPARAHRQAAPARHRARLVRRLPLRRRGHLQPLERRELPRQRPGRAEALLALDELERAGPPGAGAPRPDAPAGLRVPARRGERGARARRQRGARRDRRRPERPLQPPGLSAWPGGPGARPPYQLHPHLEVRQSTPPPSSAGWRRGSRVTEGAWRSSPAPCWRATQRRWKTGELARPSSPACTPMQVTGAATPRVPLRAFREWRSVRAIRRLRRAETLAEGSTCSRRPRRSPRRSHCRS